MKIEVMSRQKVIEFSKEIHNEKIAVISISDMDKENPELLGYPDNGIKWLHQVRFADVDVEEAGCITEKQAKRLTAFIFSVRSNAEKLIVHCEAGISRSAGVAAAIMKFLNDDDWGVFGNSRFRPNMTCYRKVLNAFYEI